MTAHGQDRPDVEWMIGGHAGPVAGVAFSADGQLAASTSHDGTTKVWGISDGALHLTVTTPDTNPSVGGGVAFSPDGSMFGSIGIGGATLWSLPDGEVVERLCCMEAGVDVAFSRDGTMVAVAGSASGIEETVIVFRLSDGATLFHADVGASGGAHAVVFSQDGQFAISGGGSPFGAPGVAGNIRYWRVSDGEEVHTVPAHDGAVFGLALSPDGTILASGGADDTVRLWSAASPSLIRTLTGHTGDVVDVAFSPDGGRIASVSKDGTIRVWDVVTGGLQYEETPHTGQIGSVAWSPDGTRLLTGGGGLLTGQGDGLVRLLDANTGTAVHTFNRLSNTVSDMSLSFDGGSVAVSDYGDLLSVQDTADGSLIRTIESPSNVSVTALAPDGSLVAADGSDGVVRIWSVATGALVRSISAHSGWLTALEFSPDGQALATSRWDEPIKLWSLQNGTLLRSIPGGAQAIDFSADGSLLAATSGNLARVLRVSDGGTVRSFTGHSAGVLDVDLSDDGTILVTGSVDRTARLWRVSDGALLRILPDHNDWVEAVALSHNGRVVATGTEFHVRTLRLFDAEDGALLKLYEVDTGSGVRPIEFTPDDRFIMYSRRDSALVAARNPFAATPGDLDGDGDIDLGDFGLLADCLAGPGEGQPPAGCTFGAFSLADLEGDGDVDLADHARFSEFFASP